MRSTPCDIHNHHQITPPLIHLSTLCNHHLRPPSPPTTTTHSSHAHPMASSPHVGTDHMEAGIYCGACTVPPCYVPDLCGKEMSEYLSKTVPFTDLARRGPVAAAVGPVRGPVQACGSSPCATMRTGHRRWLPDRTAGGPGDDSTRLLGVHAAAASSLLRTRQLYSHGCMQA